MKERHEFLKRTQLFQAVPDNILDEIQSHLQEVHYDAGSTIFKEGDPGDALYIIVDGRLTVLKGGAAVLSRGTGECVGEMALVDHAPRNNTVIAETPVRLYRLPEKDFQELFTHNSEIAAGIFRVLTAKLRENDESSARSTIDLQEHPTQFSISTPRVLSENVTADQDFAGRYYLEKKLGQGGMATVFQAHDKLLNTQVALKIMHSTLGDGQFVRRFKQEVVLARKVIHPNACRVYDFGQSGKLHFVSMELIHGKPLSEHFSGRLPLSTEEGLPVVIQFLSALAEIHRAGIVHRDLKPQNILVDETGRAVIMDFGIAKSIDLRDAHLTRTGEFLGTPFYMAPEQFEGQPLDCRADIYSVGVILYEMFTGRLPFSGDTLAAIVLSHLKGKPVPPDVPKPLKKIICKAIARKPANRYWTAAELLDEIKMI